MATAFSLQLLSFLIVLILAATKTTTGGVIGIKTTEGVVKKQAKENIPILFRLGVGAFKEQHWQKAFSHFSACLQIVNETKQQGLSLLPLDDEQGEVIEEVYLLDYAQYAAYMLGDLETALALCQNALSATSTNGTEAEREDRKTFVNLVNFYQRKLAGDPIDMIDEDKLENNSEMPNNISDEDKVAEAKSFVENSEFYYFCKSDVTKKDMFDLASKRHAVCRYDNRNRKPSLVLSPIKEEVLSLQPLVLLFHGLALDSDIQSIRQLTKNKFKESGVISLSPLADPKKQYVQKDYRKAETAWLTSTSDALQLDKLSNRIEATTSLNTNKVDGAESYQVTRYGIGGHNGPHWDVLLDAAAGPSGDRLATLLLYLNRVEEGGETVFTKLKLSVTPEIGAGLFWHNCHQNETYDARTLHAACPVIRGEKWVTNKWFRARGQARTRPCDRKRDRSYTRRHLTPFS